MTYFFLYIDIFRELEEIQRQKDEEEKRRQKEEREKLKEVQYVYCNTRKTWKIWSCMCKDARHFLGCNNALK